MSKENTETETTAATKALPSSSGYAIGDKIRLWDNPEWHEVVAVTISNSWPAIQMGNGERYWPSDAAISEHLKA